MRLFNLLGPCLLVHGQRSLIFSFLPSGIFAFKCSRAEEIFNLLQDLMQCNSINVMEEPVIITRNSHPAELGLPRAPQPPNGEETPSSASMIVYTGPVPANARPGGTRQAGRQAGMAGPPSQDSCPTSDDSWGQVSPCLGQSGDSSCGWGVLGLVMTDGPGADRKTLGFHSNSSLELVCFLLSVYWVIPVYLS